MLTLLQDIEAGIRLDGRVWKSLPKTQVIPEQSTPPESIQRERKPVFILGSVSYSCEWFLDSRRGQKTTPNLLCQPGLLRGRSQIPTHREYWICFDCSFTQVAPLLPSESYLGDDGATYKEVDEQAQGCKKDNPVGYWAQPIRHWVPP